jgi:quinohemoprotein ethanol dehydrogenase
MEHFVPLETALAVQTGVPNLGVETPIVPETIAGIDELAKVYRGNLVAWDPVKQEERWRQPYDHIHNGGTLSTAGNLVFQGTADGRVAAYTADTGEKLWEQEVTSGAVAGPITYSIDGEQYVAFNVGWGGAFAVTFGALAQRTMVVPDSNLYVFKLGGKATPPPVQRREFELPTPPPVTADAATLAQGKELFGNHCGVCHGLAVIGSNIIPDLRYLPQQKHDDFMPIIYGLQSHNGMPPFGEILEKQEIESIHQYIIQRSHDWRKEMIDSGAASAGKAE